MTENEALEEIQEVLQDEYLADLTSEIDTDLCYYLKDVISDILAEIKRIADMALYNYQIN